MSVAAVLNTAYTFLARRADEQDRSIQLFGGKDESGEDVKPTARRDLDAALGVTVGDEDDGTADSDVGDESATTNVVELHAWLSSVNRKMQ